MRTEGVPAQGPQKAIAGPPERQACGSNYHGRDPGYVIVVTKSTNEISKSPMQQDFAADILADLDSH
jgi:hypothetical protein